jgi:chemotaxis protein MotB
VVPSTPADRTTEPPALRLALVEQPAEPAQTTGTMAAAMHEGVVAFGAVLFETGEADLSPAGESVLASVATALKSKVASLPDDDTWVIRVEGHTDAQPVRGGRWSSNWQLSAARASTVVETLIADGLPADRVMAIGYADTRRVALEDAESAHARNRRTEIKLED